MWSGEVIQLFIDFNVALLLLSHSRAGLITNLTRLLLLLLGLLLLLLRLLRLLLLLLLLLAIRVHALLMLLLLLLWWLLWLAERPIILRRSVRSSAAVVLRHVYRYFPAGILRFKWINVEIYVGTNYCVSRELKPRLASGWDCEERSASDFFLSLKFGDSVGASIRPNRGLVLS
jgi:hypothetical protein